MEEIIYENIYKYNNYDKIIYMILFILLLIYLFVIFNKYN